jgi:transposase
MVTVAHIHDSKAVMLQMRVLKEIRCGIKVIIADGGYRGEIAEQVKKSFGYLIQVVMRSDDKKVGFKPTHKRWVVERTFAWFDNAEDYAETINSCLNLLKIWSNSPL